MLHKQGALRKLTILLSAFLLLLILLFGAAKGQAGLFLGVTVIDQLQWDRLASECSGTQDFDPQLLRWQGSPVPFDRNTGTVYLPQSQKTSLWEGVLTAAAEDMQLYFLEEPHMSDKGYCLWENQVFHLAVVSGGVRSETKVVLTGMPAICLWGDADDTLAQFLLLDPDNLGGQGAAVLTGCTFHKRGSTSSGASDPSLRLTLRDDQGVQVKKRLLGIREDDDWILNGMYFDPLVMREKLAYDLWQDVNGLESNPVKSSSITYVELFWNDEYRGVYGLMPRLDAKQTDLEQGYIYKLRTWSVPRAEDFFAAAGNEDIYDEAGWKAASIVFPNTGGDWAPLQAYYDFFQSGDRTGMDKLGVDYDLSNLVAYSLYCNFLQAWDNGWKNTYLVMRPNANGGYTVYQTPWDLDLTFGSRSELILDVQAQDAAWSEPKPGSANTVTYRALSETDPESMGALARDKWASWKNAGITPRRLERYVDENLQYLLASGACLRDDSHRGYFDYTAAAEQLKGWIRQRFAQLDKTLLDS